MKRWMVFGMAVLLIVAVAGCAALVETEEAAPEPMVKETQKPAAETPTTAPSLTPAVTAPEETPRVEETPPEETPPAGTETPLTPPLTPVTAKLEVVNAYPALTFQKPIYFTVAGDGSGNAYVVEQTGRILVFKDRPDVAETSVFLDLSGVVNAEGNEQGLLGLAFHPDYQKNGCFYVNYTDQEGTVVAQYVRDEDDAYAADPDSGQVLLTFNQPYANHNAGHLAFGPDGYLYIATGDGGSGGDPEKHSQNTADLLGNILRIDVDKPEGGKLYGIPADNPFAGNDEGIAGEIFAYGLRNPWRFSFDANGRLWAADVGQNMIEEIDIIEAGGNYGWNVMEGTQAFEPTPGANLSDMIPPVWEYEHDMGNCVTGGYVYPGDEITDLTGRYIYGDYGSGNIWALWVDENAEPVNQELADTDYFISSFGLAADGDIRIVDLLGSIYKFAAMEE